MQLHRVLWHVWVYPFIRLWTPLPLFLWFTWQHVTVPALHLVDTDAVTVSSVARLSVLLVVGLFAAASMMIAFSAYHPGHDPKFPGGYRRATALHEAAHATIAWRCPQLMFHHATIAKGDAHVEVTVMKPEAYLAYVAVALASVAMEQRLFGRPSGGCSGDLAKAFRIAFVCTQNPFGAYRIVRRYLQHAEEFVQLMTDDIGTVADVLLEKSWIGPADMDRAIGPRHSTYTFRITVQQ